MLAAHQQWGETDDNLQMSCFPEMYLKQGIKNHRSCASNIAEVMAPHGMNTYLEVTGQCTELTMVYVPF